MTTTPPPVPQPVAAPVERDQNGRFSMVIMVGSTTTHAAVWDWQENAALACTGQRPANAGYDLRTGDTARDVTCKRCRPLVPARQRSTPRTPRRPQINHKLCAHAATPYARRQCRNHATNLPTLATMVDQAYQAVMDANASTPYVHAEYKRCDRVLNALLLAYTNGDEAYAYALRMAFLDSGENLAYYLAWGTREDLIEQFH